MKRRNWLLALFGIGAAQAQDSWVAQALKGKWHGCLEPQWSATCKATNGQCPVCGTMAPSYKPDKHWCADYFGMKPGDAAPGCEADVYVTRCRTCNAAFFQDAERRL